MSVFCHSINVDFYKLSCLLQKYLIQLNIGTQLKLGNIFLCVILHKVLIENTDSLSIYFKSTHMFANFTTGIVGNEMGNNFLHIHATTKCFQRVYIMF